jgi:hypothetical protein
VLLSPEGQTEQAWEPSKNQCFLEIGKIGEKIPSLYSELLTNLIFPHNTFMNRRHFVGV